jgi:O-methyltransferase involved in polyketide biosynthesis
MLDFAWTEWIRQSVGRPFLLLAEGVLPHLAEADVRQFVLGAGTHLGEVELVFDAISPDMLWIHNLQLAGAKLEARLHWGLRHSRDLERWGPGIHLTGEWTYFDRSEPRLGWMNRLRSVTPISRAQTIPRYTIEGSGSEPGIGQVGEQPMDHEQEQPAHA